VEQSVQVRPLSRPPSTHRFTTYHTHDDINPLRIVPVGPELDLARAHGRERL